jgi:hypothetical protein
VIVNVNTQLTRARPQWRVMRKPAVALLQPNTSSMPTSSNRSYSIFRRNVANGASRRGPSKRRPKVIGGPGCTSPGAAPGRPAVEDARPVKRVKFRLYDKRAALVDLGRHLGFFEMKRRQQEETVEVDIEDVRDTILRTLARLAAARRSAGGDQVLELTAVTQSSEEM